MLCAAFYWESVIPKKKNGIHHELFGKVHTHDHNSEVASVILKEQK